MGVAHALRPSAPPPATPISPPGGKQDTTLHRGRGGPPRGSPRVAGGYKEGGRRVIPAGERPVGVAHALRPSVPPPATPISPPGGKQDTTLHRGRGGAPGGRPGWPAGIKKGGRL